MKIAPHPARLALMLAAALPVLIPGCGCDDGLGNLAPIGDLEPATFDYGPVADGAECPGILKVTNSGQSDLSVEGGEITGASGDFTLTFLPQLVGLGGKEDVKILYKATGPLGQRQSATLEVKTNTPDNLREGGMLYATLTALPTDATAAVAQARCVPSPDDDKEKICEEIDFGAVPTDDNPDPVQRPGKNVKVKVVNEGTAELRLQGAFIDGGNTDFVITGFFKGENLTHVADYPLAEDIVIPPGREGECGTPIDGADNSVIVDVKYAPTAAGADADTLVLTTDAVEGSFIEIPLTGFGSEIGLFIDPEYLSFGDVTEGSSSTIDVRVSNLGTSEFRVDTTCIDANGNGSCDDDVDGDCTGGDPALGGILSCDVVDAGKGFVLGATDAAAGGDDEATIQVTFAPEAGNAEIPAGVNLRIEGATFNYDVPVVGSAAGILAYNSDNICNTNNVCVPATGDAGDTTTWVGETTLILENTGDASVVISSFEWEDLPTIADDFSLLGTDNATEVDLGNPGLTVGVGQSISLNVHYANNDFSTEDFLNLYVNHNGVGGQTTVPVAVIPPN
jgi:hypothetical protein